jgi:hypothetical protein
LAARPAGHEKGAGKAPALLGVVLLCVLASFGMLVAALVTAGTGWAWGSVGASGVAAGLLVADRIGRRHGVSSMGAAADGDPRDHGADTRPQPQPFDELDAVDLDPAVEPPEEDTDAADAIMISDLTDEVWVIDERPRYHLHGCRWIGQRDTIPLLLTEARELGFTPCAICTPDSRLAAAHRATRRRGDDVTS